MKIKEQTIKELENMNSTELMIIYDFILSFKRKDVEHIEDKRNDNGRESYMKVRNALKSCKGSMSEDISLEREDRI